MNSALTAAGELSPWLLVMVNQEDHDLEIILKVSTLNELIRSAALVPAMQQRIEKLESRVEGLHGLYSKLLQAVNEIQD